MVAGAAPGTLRRRSRPRYGSGTTGQRRPVGRGNARPRSDAGDAAATMPRRAKPQGPVRPEGLRSSARSPATQRRGTAMRIGRDHHRRRDRRQPGGRQIMPRWPAGTIAPGY